MKNNNPERKKVLSGKRFADRVRAGINKSIVVGILTILIPAATTFAADSWIRIESKNFDLIGNAEDHQIREVATKLEQFRNVFGRLFSRMKLNSPVPTTVIVFKNTASFAPYKSTRWASGYFLSAEDKNYIVLPFSEDRADTYAIIFHEYVHFLVTNNFGRTRIPLWFNEGIAEYYDKFEIRGDQTVRLGGVSINHIDTLRRHKLIPFQTFFTTKQSELSQQAEHGASIFYAQAWVFMHYLIQGGNPLRTRQFNSFMNRMLDGEVPEFAFRNAFAEDFSNLESELREYISDFKNIRESFLRLDQKLVFDSEMERSHLSRADSSAYLGDLLFQGGQHEAAESMLKTAIGLDPRSSLANTSMGLLRIRQNRLSEARRFLESAVNANTPSYRAYYYYAFVLVRERNVSSGTGEKIRELLRKSIAMNPDFAPQYDLMAAVSLEMDDHYDEGISYLETGVKLAPGNQGYLLNLANLYLRKRLLEKAEEIVDAVLLEPEDSEIQTYGEALRKNLGELRAERAGNEYAAVDDDQSRRRLTRKKTFELPPGLTNEEYERRKREVEIRGINESLRKPEENERRILGTLLKITCNRRLARYLLKAGGGTVTLNSNGFSSLKFMTYNVDASDIKIGCEMIKRPMFGVFTYKPYRSGADGIGELVAVEFVPDYFTLSND